MKKKLVAMAVASIFVLTLAFMIAGPFNGIAGASNTDRWEYKSFHTFDHDERDTALNELGQDGWELVAIYDGRSYLKRRLP